MRRFIATNERNERRPQRGGWMRAWVKCGGGGRSTAPRSHYTAMNIYYRVLRNFANFTRSRWMGEMAVHTPNLFFIVKYYAVLQTFYTLWCVCERFFLRQSSALLRGLRNKRAPFIMQRNQKDQGCCAAFAGWAQRLEACEAKEVSWGFETLLYYGASRPVFVSKHEDFYENII